MAFDLLARLAYMALPLGPLRVLMVYAEQTRSGDTITPWLSERKLAAFTGMAPGTIKSHRATLLRLGLLAPLPERHGKTGRRVVYRLNLPPLDVVKAEAWARLEAAGGDVDSLPMGANSQPLREANGHGFSTIAGGNGYEISTMMGTDFQPLAEASNYRFKTPVNTRKEGAPPSPLDAVQQTKAAAKAKREGTTFAEWFALLDGADPFADYPPLRAAADAIGLSDDHLRACFWRFRTYWTESKPQERKANWRLAFLNAIKRDGYGCWGFDAKERPVLTATGHAALKLRDAAHKGQA